MATGALRLWRKKRLAPQEGVLFCSWQEFVKDENAKRGIKKSIAQMCEALSASRHRHRPTGGRDLAPPPVPWVFGNTT